MYMRADTMLLLFVFFAMLTAIVRLWFAIPNIYLDAATAAKQGLDHSMSEDLLQIISTIQHAANVVHEERHLHLCRLP